MGVKVREKELKSGKKSLYLDINHNGHRRYKFLKLYTIPGETRHNKEVKRLAKEARNKEEAKLLRQRYSLQQPTNPDASFYEFYQKIVDRNLKKGIYNHKEVLAHVKDFHGKPTLRFRDIDKRFVVMFRDYLEDNFTPNTAANYWVLFRAGLSKAVEIGIIARHPAEGVNNLKSVETETHPLTEKELTQLRTTLCSRPTVKRAFLFSCNTGLRLSDVRKLQWKEVREDRIHFTQKKTTKVDTVPLNDKALELIGTQPKNASAKVFDLPESYSTIWHAVKDWGEDAGLDRHLRFHRSRHTFGTRLGKAGLPIQNIASLMGITPKTAERYVHPNEAENRQAVNDIAI